MAPYRLHWEHIEEHWDAFKPQAKEKWRKLSEEDLDYVGGNRDKLVSKLKEAYGLSDKEVEAELHEFALPENVM